MDSEHPCKTLLVEYGSRGQCSIETAFAVVMQGRLRGTSRGGNMSLLAQRSLPWCSCCCQHAPSGSMIPNSKIGFLLPGAFKSTSYTCRAFIANQKVRTTSPSNNHHLSVSQSSHGLSAGPPRHWLSDAKCNDVSRVDHALLPCGCFVLLYRALRAEVPNHTTTTFQCAYSA